LTGAHVGQSGLTDPGERSANKSRVSPVRCASPVAPLSHQHSNVESRGFTPVYRQSQIFARHGVEIERSTLANWVGGACYWLEPLQVRLAAHVFMLKGRI
jgi:hypothetical protein